MASLVTCKLWRWGTSAAPGGAASANNRLASVHRLLESSGAGGGWNVRLIGACDSSSQARPSPRPDRVSRGCGYHPLEELSVQEGSEKMAAQRWELSNAEVARTMADVNWSAVVFASMSSQETAILGTEVQYLIDERGDFFFEMEEDDNLLHDIGGLDSHTVVIGIGNVDEIEIADLIGAVGMDEGEEEGEGEGEDEEEESDGDYDITEDWELVGSGELDDLVEDWDGWASDQMGSLWPSGAFETLDYVHPLEFGSKVAEVSAFDQSQTMDKPSRHLTITGSVRRMSKEEEAYVQRKWFDRFFHDVEDVEAVPDAGARVKEQDESVVGSTWEEKSSAGSDRLSDSRSGAVSRSVKGSGSDSDVSASPSPADCENDEGAQEAVDEERPFRRLLGSSSGRGRMQGVDKGEKKKVMLLGGPPAEKVGEDDRRRSSDTDTCFYKLKMMRIHLDYSSGVQLTVDVQDFRNAQPDVIAHSAPMIIQRVNSAGQMTERALKALCKREKGLKVEEAALVGLDCLGIDVRIQAGIELKTLRFPFPKRATSQEMAETLLEKLLFP